MFGFSRKKLLDFSIGKIDICVYNVVKRYDSVLFAGISNVRLKEKFWKSVQNSLKFFFSLLAKLVMQI